MPRAVSEVWRFFTKRGGRVHCDLCVDKEKSYVDCGSSTMRFWKHLENVHPVEFASTERGRSTSSSAAGSGRPTPKDEENIGEHSNSASSHPTTPSPGPNNNPIRTVALVKKRKKAAIRIPKSSQPAIPLPDRPLTRPEERVVNCQVCSKPLKIRLDSEIRDHLIQRHAPMVARAIGGAGNDPVLLWVRKCCIDEAPDSTQLTTTGRRKRTAVNPVPAITNAPTVGPPSAKRMKIEQPDVSPEMANSKDSVDIQNTTRLSVDIASSDDDIPLAVGAKQRRKTKLVRKKKPMEPIEDVQCGMCKQSLPPNEIILRQHLLRDHLDAVLYQCSECDYSNSYRKWPIALHMAECHSDGESKATVNDHSHLYRTEIIDLKQRCFPNFD